MARYRREHQGEKRVYSERYYREHREALKTQSREYKLRIKEEGQIVKEASGLNISVSPNYVMGLYLKAHPLCKKRSRGWDKVVMRALAEIWYQQHTEGIRAERLEGKEATKLRGIARKGEIALNAKHRRYELKLEVLTHYSGGSCACIQCGEGRLFCLSIDHINGGGNRHIKQIQRGGKSFYQWLKENDYPEGYQTLCMNCQFCKQAIDNGWYEPDG